MLGGRKGTLHLSSGLVTPPVSLAWFKVSSPSWGDPALARSLDLLLREETVACFLLGGKTASPGYTSELKDLVGKKWI